MCKKALPFCMPTLTGLLLALLTGCGSGADEGSAPHAHGQPDGRAVPKTHPHLARSAELRTRAPVSGTDGLDDSGLRGDVLAQVLRNGTNHHDSRSQRMLYTQAVPWNAAFEQGGEPQSALSEPVFYIDQRVERHDSGALGRPVLRSRSFTQSPRINADTLELALGLSAQGDLPAASPQDRPEDELLQLGNRLDIKLSAVHAPPSQASTSRSLMAASVQSLRRHDRLAWDSPIQTWGDPQADHVHLRLLRGGDPREFGVCFETRVQARYTLLQRQSCSLWQMPADWSAGLPLPYRGHYIRDTELIDAGDGHVPPSFDTHYWRSPPDRLHALPTGPRPKPEQRPAIDFQSIRGDVLAAMFEALTPGRQPARALPLTGHASVDSPTRPSHLDLFGSLPHPEPRVPATISLQQLSRPLPDRPGNLLYMQRSGAYLRPSHDQAAILDYGQTTLALHVHHHRDDAGGHLTLARWLGLRHLSILPDGRPNWTFNGELIGGDRRGSSADDDPRSLRIRYDQRVNYGSPLQLWSVPASSDPYHHATVELRLHAPRQPERPILCWVITTSSPIIRMNREICTTWQVSPDWQPGDPLEPVSWHISDGQSIRVDGRMVARSRHQGWNTTVQPR